MRLEVQGLTPSLLVHDQDTKFRLAFDNFFRCAESQIVKTPVSAPNANAYAEAWVGSVKRECLDHFLSFGLRHLDHIGQEYVHFHNVHRPHQGLGNRTVAQAATGPPDDPLARVTPDFGRIRCERFLGGLLRHYYRAA